MVVSQHHHISFMAGTQEKKGRLVAAPTRVDSLSYTPKTLPPTNSRSREFWGTRVESMARK